MKMGCQNKSHLHKGDILLCPACGCGLYRMLDFFTGFIDALSALLDPLNTDVPLPPTDGLPSCPYCHSSIHKSGEVETLQRGPVQLYYGPGFFI